MNIVLMMLRAARPSRIADMPVVAKSLWFYRGYDALTFFGTIITHNTQGAEALSRLGFLKNHEMIHLYQARSCHDSWLFFYLRYGYYWLRALPYHRRLKNSGYLLNPFEMEAYQHMHDLHYLDDKPSGTTEWHTFARLSLAERFKIVKHSN